MKIIFSTILVLLFAGLNIVSAHNLWIETAATGKVGKEQVAKVYLGGYGENERDSTANWFGNTREFVLWITDPSGEKKQLTTKAAGNCFEAVFTPGKEGVYTISLMLELSEVYNKKKYAYHAATQVSVGASTLGQNNLLSATDLSAQIANTKVAGKNALVKVQYKGKSLGQTGVAVASPATWVKSVETETDGSFSFEALWTGLYVVEVFYTEKSVGKVGEQAYESVSHIATYSVTLTK